MKIYPENEIKSLIALFKVVPKSATLNAVWDKNVSALECARNGFVLASNDVGVFIKTPEQLFNIINSCYGLKTKENNQTFHKSFNTVVTMSDERYCAEQLMHYFSTYTLESIGIDRSGIPAYVPTEQLDMPEGMIPTEKIVVIEAVGDGKCVELIDNFLLSVRAPSDTQVELITPILKYASLPTDNIRSFEIQIIKHSQDKTVPSNPVSFLRYLVYKTTGGYSLLIKNKELVSIIHTRAYICGDKTRKILEQADFKKLAEIFYRFKPIFLAFKAHAGCAPIINKIRRLAEKYHKPLSQISIQNVIELARRGSEKEVEALIEKADSRTLIKLFNAVKTKISATNETPEVFIIRNGKIFVKEDEAETNLDALIKLGAMILAEIRNKMGDKLKNKVFYIPEYITYAAPFSEKQMVDNIPYGSYLNVAPTEAFTAGIHWLNTNGRTDLDLHMRGVSESFGWNAAYMDRDSSIVFTGDMTDAPAPNGAAEAYFIKPKANGIYIMAVYKYSGVNNVPFEFFMTTGDTSIQHRNYTYDPKRAAFSPIPMAFRNTNQMTVGMFINRRFYFFGGTFNNSIVPTKNMEAYIKGFSHILTHRMTLNDFIVMCGGKVITDKEGMGDAESDHIECIDLSPEALKANTLFDVVDGTITN